MAVSEGAVGEDGHAMLVHKSRRIDTQTNVEEGWKDEADESGGGGTDEIKHEGDLIEPDGEEDGHQCYGCACCTCGQVMLCEMKGELLLLPFRRNKWWDLFKMSIEMGYGNFVCSCRC